MTAIVSEPNWSELLQIVERSYFKLIDESARTQLESFIEEKELPEEVDRDFVQAIQQALSGLTPVEISSQSLENVLFPNGAAATIEDFKDRFAEYLDSLVKGQDRSKVRLVLKKDGSIRSD